MIKQVLLYLPVIHAGYEAWLERHYDADEVLLVGSSFAAMFPVMDKEIRALPPQRAAAYLAAAGPAVRRVRVVEVGDLPGAVVAPLLVLPAEDITRGLVSGFRLDRRAEIRFEKTFLRWDREWSRAQRPVGYDHSTTVDETARRFAAAAGELADRSSDWWRQVGAVAVADGAALFSDHNRHSPSEYSPYLNGDPRNNFRRGISIDLSTATHAEASIVARAARLGPPLEGADLYVSTFPCPGCARLVAAAGFARCFFAGPYAMLDGERVLRDAGTELIWVDMGAPGPS